MIIKAIKRDYMLILAVFMLVTIGLIFIYSASNYTAKETYNNSYYFVIKQAIGAVIGLILMLIMIKISLEKVKKYSFILLIISYILLILVFVPEIGIENYGAKRWIGFSFISFQPSELAKFALVIFAAMYMSRKDFQGKSALSYLPVAAAGGLMCILIILEPNMSVTVCVGLIMLCMLFVGGLNKKAFIIFILCAVCALPILILLEPYRMQRFVAFLNPFASAKDEGYQLVQSLYALGSGGWFGVGLFNSRQKYKFLPFAESDFILSVIGEEIGFIGVLVVIAIFVFIIYKGVKIAINAKDRFCGLLSGGITFVIAIQTIINIAVVSASIPPTGIPLPFISMGGSSLAVFMGAVGLLLNVHNKS